MCAFLIISCPLMDRKDHKGKLNMTKTESPIGYYIKLAKVFGNLHVRHIFVL